MRCQFLLALAVVLLGICGPSRGADAAKEELKKLQGEWPVVAEEVLGHDILAPLGEPKIVFDGDKLTFKMRGRDASYGVKLDPSASPKAADFTQLEGPNKGKVTPGVYHLDGDELWICFGQAGGARPDGFATRGLAGRTLLKCKRPKTPDKDTAKEMKKLVGTWVAVSAEYAGKPYSEDFAKKLKYVISEGKILTSWNGSEGTCTYELDISTNPKGIKTVAGSADAPGARCHGIYQLDGDELIICLDSENAPRPTKFETKPKSQTALYKFKRQKP
jgi:uncharacterized protein (TIGR03067 family)